MFLANTGLEDSLTIILGGAFPPTSPECPEN
jgi:hypothetical protein